jgi:hypothetical protein
MCHQVALHQKVKKDDQEAMNNKLLAMAEVLGHSRDKLTQQSAGPSGSQ